jgi:hypothetical protein
MRKQLDRSMVLRIGSVKDRTLRACYLCEEILGQPGVFESESLYHMFIVCPHSSMRDLRARLEDDVKNLCRWMLTLSPQSHLSLRGVTLVYQSCGQS